MVKYFAMYSSFLPKTDSRYSKNIESQGIKYNHWVRPNSDYFLVLSAKIDKRGTVMLTLVYFN